MIQRFSELPELPELSRLSEDSERRMPPGSGVILGLVAGGLFWGVVIQLFVWWVWG